MSLINRFIRYARIDTQSNENSNATPSSSNQLVLLHLLLDELTSFGVEGSIDEYGRLYAHIDGNDKYPTIGLCAHVDTAGECSGKNVNPQIINNYDGQDIPLGKSGLVLSSCEFIKLKSLKGKTLVVTDGRTLLGADDKAGVAIIMDVIEPYLKIDRQNRYPLSILFTPDEEIGRGAEHFNLDKFKAKYAYTIDGDDPKFIAIENFNAKSALVSITGKSIHPGDAKGIMVNAILVLNQFMSLLPPDMIPSKTEGHEGFNHVTSISGDVEHAEAHYILRNHDLDILNEQVKDFEKAKVKTLSIYPNAKIEIVFADQYKNMLQIIKDNPECQNHLVDVYNRLGIKFEYDPIRGGTDGATFSYLGCPTPNIGTGSYNHHGRYEYAVVEEMEEIKNIILALFVIK